MSTKPSAGPERFMTIGLLLAIVMLGMGLRLYQLDADSLWLDEITTVITSRLDFVSMLDYQAEESVHPPFLYVVTRFFLARFGDSDFVVRLPAALLGSLSVLLTYKLGEMLWTRKEGLIGAFLLAINAYHIRYSQEARHYSLMVFLALLSLIVLLQALKGNRKGMWILFGLCTSLNLYSHYFAFLILPSELLFAAWVILDNRRELTRQLTHRALDGPVLDHSDHQPAEREDISPSVDSVGPASLPTPSPREQGLYLVAALALVGVSYLPWLPFMWRQIHGAPIAYEGLGLEGLPRAELSVRFVGKALQTYTGLDGIPLLLFLALFALGLASCKSRCIVLFGAWIAIPFLFPFVVRSGHFFNVRYAVFVVPIFFLGMARGISALIRWLTRQLPLARFDERYRLALTVVLIVFTLGTLSVTPLRDYYREQKEDWRSAAAYLLNNMGTTDVIIADGQGYGPGADAGRTLSGLSYYFSLAGKTATVFQAQTGLPSRLDEMTDHSASAWGVLWHPADLANLEQVDPDFEVIEFPKVAVITPLASHGDLLANTRSLMETLVLLQPTPSGRIDLHLALAEIYLRDANQAAAQRHTELAAAAARRARQSEANVYFLLGEAYLEIGGVEEAVSAYEQAVRIEPDHTQARRRLELLARAFDEHIPSPLFRRLGFQVALLGYGLGSTTASAGTTVEVTLWWLALGRMDKDYTAFIHVTDAEGHLWAQDDRVLEHDGQLTSTWEVAQSAREEYHLALPPDAPSGEYTVQAGLYYWETGERLAVWDKNGRRLPGDTIVLDHITITD